MSTVTEAQLDQSVAVIRDFIVQRSDTAVLDAVREMKQAFQQLTQEFQQLKQDVRQEVQAGSQAIRHELRHLEQRSIARSYNSALTVTLVGSKQALEPVVDNNGNVPAAWPQDLSAAGIGDLPATTVTNLLRDYGQDTAGAVNVKRQRLAKFVGAGLL